MILHDSLIKYRYASPSNASGVINHFYGVKQNLSVTNEVSTGINIGGRSQNPLLLRVPAFTFVLTGYSFFADGDTGWRFRRVKFSDTDDPGYRFYRYHHAALS